MALLIFVIACTAASAILAIALVATPAGRRNQPSLFSGLIDWRL
jgi:hypothetical protein